MRILFCRNRIQSDAIIEKILVKGLDHDLDREKSNPEYKNKLRISDMESLESERSDESEGDKDRLTKTMMHRRDIDITSEIEFF